MPSEQNPSQSQSPSVQPSETGTSPSHGGATVGGAPTPDPDTPMFKPPLLDQSLREGFQGRVHQKDVDGD